VATLTAASYEHIAVVLTIEVLLFSFGRCSRYPAGLRAPLIVTDPNDPSYYGYDSTNDIVFNLADAVSSLQAFSPALLVVIVCTTTE